MLRVLFATARPPFLALTPVCVLAGLATARWATGAVAWTDAALALVGALAAHVSVNMLNEYFDFRSGLDARTERTPFSGGSGALPAYPADATAVLAVGVGALVLAAVIGLRFLATRGAALLPLGLAGLVVVAAYTPWITRQPVASLLAPGLGFGPLMVVGTHVALTGEYHRAAWAISLIPFCLVNGLLLLNQFPDVEADRSVGRRHLPMLWGRAAAARVHSMLLAGAYASLGLALALGWLPWPGALGALTLPLAVRVAALARRHADDVPALGPALALNVVVTLSTPALVAVGVLAASPS